MSRPLEAGGCRPSATMTTSRSVTTHAFAGRWLRAWHSPVPVERIVGIAGRPRASAGTSRGHAGARWRTGTWACRSAAIPAGGFLSWATDRRNSPAAVVGFVTIDDEDMSPHACSARPASGTSSGSSEPSSGAAQSSAEGPAKHRDHSPVILYFHSLWSRRSSAACSTFHRSPTRSAGGPR